MVRQYVPERCGVSLSRSSCLNYLHRLGFAFKRPKKHLLKAQAEKREAFVVSRDARVERSWVVRGVAFMVQENFEVRLSPAEKEQLRKLMRAGRSSARAITRARILVKTDEGWNASQVAAVLGRLGADRVPGQAPVRGGGIGGGVAAPQLAQPVPEVDDRVEAHPIALACSQAPGGHDHWTLRALAGKAVELGLVESLSHGTVRLRLKKKRSSRGRGNSGASRK